VGGTGADGAGGVSFCGKKSSVTEFPEKKGCDQSFHENVPCWRLTAKRRDNKGLLSHGSPVYGRGDSV
jgi:hypothetical protein